MSGRDEEVLQRMRDELHKRPEIPEGILFALAQQIDPDLAGMDPRSFGARYLYPVRQSLQKEARKKRRSRPRRRSRKKPAPASTSSPEPQPAPEPKPTFELQATPEPQSPPLEPQPSASVPVGPPPRAQIRAAFLDFARELADAEHRTDLVRAVARVDDYAAAVVALLHRSTQ